MLFCFTIINHYEEKHYPVVHEMAESLNDLFGYVHKLFSRQNHK